MLHARLNKWRRPRALAAFIRVGTGGGGEMFSSITGVQVMILETMFSTSCPSTGISCCERPIAGTIGSLPRPSYPTSHRVAALAANRGGHAATRCGNPDADNLLAGVVSRQQRAMVSSIMLGLFLPAVNAAIEAEDPQKRDARVDSAGGGAGRVSSRARRLSGQFDQLVPGVLEALPVDVFSGKPFVYNRDGNGYLL